MIGVEIHEATGRNIKKSQEKQKRNFDRRHLSSTNVKVGDRVLLENKRRHDRKGEKFSYRWLRPYTVKALNKNGLASLESSKGIVLKQKYNSALLKPHIETRMRKPMLLTGTTRNGLIMYLMKNRGLK